MQNAVAIPTEEMNSMKTTGLLALGATEIIDHNTQELLGHAYTIAHGQGQLQRWLLFRHPENELAVRSPSEEMAKWTLEDWQNHVENLWQPDGYYVWAQADVYEYEGTYDGVTWSQIPSADQLPAASFPERPGSDFQLDYLDGRIIELFQDDRRGQAYVVRGLSEASSIEYWHLPARFEPAGMARTRVTRGREIVGSLHGFVEKCQPYWSSGSKFVITGCLNHHARSAPYAP
jgi:hypothetical protein